MTKHIRIENADTSTYKVEVQIWEKRGAMSPDIHIETLALDYPTQQITPYITNSRYIVIKEKQ